MTKTVQVAILAGVFYLQIGHNDHHQDQERKFRDQKTQPMVFSVFLYKPPPRDICEAQTEEGKGVDRAEGVRVYRFIVVIA